MPGQPTAGNHVSHSYNRRLYRREEGARRDLERRGQGPRPSRGQRVRRRLRHQVAQAAAKIADDLDVLLAFYDYPAEHWIHLRTTNPIESTFATVTLRQQVTKGPGSRAVGVAMAFKLIESAQTRWRAVNAPHLVALVRVGAAFKNGKLIERPDESEGGDPASRVTRRSSHPSPSPPAAVARAVSGIRVSAAADKGHDRHLTRPA